MMMERSGHERRQYSRYSVDWVASVMHKSNGGNELYRDRLRDISLGGASFYSNLEIYSDQPLVMLIEIPLPYGKIRKSIAGIECALCKPVFSDEKQQFHSGVQFLRYYGIDKHLLAEALFSQNKAAVRRNQQTGSHIY